MQMFCPSCGAKLYSHEVAGGECTSCMKPLPKGYTGSPPPPGSERAWLTADYREPSSARSTPGGYYNRPAAPDFYLVRLGVNLIRWGLGGYFLIAIVGAGLQVLTAATVGREAIGFGMLMTVVVAIAQIICALTMFVGTCCCCAVPAYSQGRPWAIGLIVCILLNILLAGLVVLLAISAHQIRAEADFSIGILAVLAFAVLVMIGSSLCFCMLLRGVARDFDDRSLGNGFLAYFFVSTFGPLIFYGLLIAFIAVAAQSAARSDFGPVTGLVCVMSCAALVGGLALFIWLMTLLSRLYNLIPSSSTGGYRESRDWD